MNDTKLSLRGGYPVSRRTPWRVSPAECRSL